ncbi:MAG: polyphosphate kinase 2 family protein [Verrucomicrobia bacterium]|nr:polyphosphate kinase 2 family protein [Verrucomicrobiota bacterium]
MKTAEIIEDSKKFIAPFRVTAGQNFRLEEVDPNNTGQGIAGDKTKAKELLQQGVKALADLQDKLYAQDQWAILLIFQAMDAAGKDGAIKHVMSGVNPQGCQVYSFKSPSAEDLNHDYLWRSMRCLPERGRIGIFNRSYYEETLVVRVHPELLAKQRIPECLMTKDIWDDRYKDIRHFERYLTNNGVVIRKFFLHVSADEQRKRFLQRLDSSAKNWKFSEADSRERGFWNDYMKAYQETICNTAADYAPWYVVPANNKWFTRLVVAAVVIDALAALNLQYPQVGEAQRQQLEIAKKALEKEERQ